MTAVHLLTYNPERWAWDDYDETVESVRRGRVIDSRWSVAQRVHGIEIRDWVFLLRQGPGERGLLGAGQVATKPYADEHWDGGGRTAQYVDVDWLELLPLDDVIPLDAVRTAVPEFGWDHVYSSGRTVPEPSATALLALWERWTSAATPGVLSDSLYEEGAPITIVARRYERSRAAREACIQVHGHACAVCGFVFSQRYGDIGRDYIQVHHVVPLHVAGRAQHIDPARDMRPVCANCHVMLHRSQASDESGRIMTPDELAASLEP